MRDRPRLLREAGLELADRRAFQANAAADNTFFGASNSSTYLTRRPG